MDEQKIDDVHSKVNELSDKIVLSMDEEEQVSLLVKILNEIAGVFELAEGMNVSPESQRKLNLLKKGRGEYMEKLKALLAPEVSLNVDEAPPKRAKLNEDSDLKCRLKQDTLTQTPGVSLEDIAGLKEAKSILKEAVILPHLLPNYFSSKIREPWKGVLLFGPPGTGKSTIARAVATECNCAFFNASPSTFSSKWVGEAEKSIRYLFELAEENSPAVIFFDEIDAVASKRGSPNESETSRKVKTELLIRLDEIQKRSLKVTVLAATNFPWQLDAAFLRRLEQRVYIPLPNAEVIEEMVRIKFRDLTVSKSLNYKEIAEKMVGFSGSDINNFSRMAATENMRKVTKGLSLDAIKKLDERLATTPVTMEDCQIALSKIKKTVTSKELDAYNLWNKEQGST